MKGWCMYRDQMIKPKMKREKTLVKCVYLNWLSNLCYKGGRELQVFNSPFCKDDNLGIGIYDVGIESKVMNKQEQV